MSYRKIDKIHMQAIYRQNLQTPTKHMKKCLCTGDRVHIFVNLNTFFKERAFSPIGLTNDLVYYSERDGKETMFILLVKAQIGKNFLESNLATFFQSLNDLHTWQ